MDQDRRARVPRTPVDRIEHAIAVSPGTIGQPLFPVGLQNLETGDRHDRPNRSAVAGDDLNRDPAQVVAAHACLEMAVGVDADG